MLMNLISDYFSLSKSNLGMMILKPTTSICKDLKNVYVICLHGFPSSENISSSVSGGGQYASAASESLARRAQATVQDPVFHKMKGQFTSDFDFIQLGAMKLHNLIHKLKKWIKILEARVKLLPKYVSTNFYLMFYL